MNKNTFLYFVRSEIRRLEYSFQFSIFVLALVFGQISFAQSLCEIEVNLTFPGYGDTTEWKLIDGSGNIVLSGGPYNYMEYEDFTISENYIAINPPYSLQIISDDSQNYFCDNELDYSVMVGGVQDISGNMLACYELLEETFPLNADFIDCIADCLPPSDINITAIAVDSAMLSWSSSSTENEMGYSYEVRTVGEPGTGGDGLVISGNTTNAVLTASLEGLEGGVTYTVYLKANCTDEDSSSWTAGISFTTSLVMPTPWHENFSSNSVPNQWNTTGWNIGTGASSLNPAYNGRYIYKNLYSGDSNIVGTFETVNIGPILEGDYFTFVYKLAGYSNPYTPPETGSGNFTVEISTDLGATYTVVSTIQNNGIAGWQNFTMNMEEYIDDIVRVRVTANRLTGDYNIGFDEFDISNENTCMEVSGLAVNSSVITTATISWLKPLNVHNNGYVYELRTEGEPGTGGGGLITSGVIIDPDELLVIIDSLEFNKDYAFYIKGNCNEGISSHWSTLNFSTLKVTPSPWFEGFATPNTPIAWDTQGWGIGTNTALNPGAVSNYIYKNLFGFSSTASFNTIVVGPIAEGEKFSVKYKTVNYASPYASPGSGSGNFKVSISTDFGITYTDVATVNNTNNGGWQDLLYDLENYTGELIKIKITGNRNMGDYYLAFDSFMIANEESCVFPINVAIEESGDTNVTFKWDKPASVANTGYTYELRTSGEAGSGEVGLAFTGIIEDADELTVAFQDLSFTTAYTFYIRTNCSDEENSSWSAGIVYITLPVTPSPWHEGFNTTSTPNGWNRGGWSINSSIEGISLSDETNYIYKNLYGYSSSGTFTTIDVGPILVADSLSFVYRLKNYSGSSVPAVGSGNFKIEISKDFGVTYTELETIANNGVAGWQDFNYDLSEYVGEYVRVKITGNTIPYDDFDYYLVFDDFEISGVCPEVTSVEIEDIISSSALVDIESEATSFDIEYGEAGFEQGEGTIVIGASSPYGITGLEAETEYDVYVRANCNDVTYGEWFGPVSFTTILGLSQTITATDVTKVYGAAPFIHGSSDSELSLTYTIEDETIAKVVAGEIVILKAGTTEITASQPGNGDYSPAWDVEFNLIVNKAPLIISADDVTKVFDSIAYVPSLVSYEGFVYQDTITSLSGSLVFSGTGVDAINAGTYTLLVSDLTSSNYDITFEEGTLLINKKDIEGITFVGATKIHDGEAHSIFVTGELPESATVVYQNNEKTEIGDYTVIAEIDNGDNYNILTLEAVMKIRHELEGITFEDTSFTYDGTEKSLAISGDLPEGVSVTYEGNGEIEAGEYTITALISGGATYADFSLTATLTIEKASLNDIIFADGSFVYDGESKSITIPEGDIPEGVTVTYAGNDKVNAGEYVVTATLVGGNNYENRTATAELEITKAILSGIIFEDGTFVHDGSSKSILVEGELPEGVSIVYINNGKIDVGVYTVTAEFSGGINYEDMNLTATLTIETGTIDWVTLSDAVVGYDGTVKSLLIAGVLPTGVSVSYINNEHINLGTYTVTANIDGGINYHDFSLTATLTIEKGNINGVSLPNATYVYDGMQKSLAISGDLPAGTSVTYQNNGHVEVGVHTVIATISGGANYNDLVLTGTLKITKLGIDGISFDNATFTYDGTAKSIYINGTLPTGVTVSYQNNSKVNAGLHTVIASINGGVNYASYELTATLTIQKATQTITFNELDIVILEDTNDFQLAAVASSGLPISYTYSFTGVEAASVSENGWVTLQQAGEIIITAHQKGDINYIAATPVTRKMIIESRNATIDELMINDVKYVNPAEELYYVVDCGAMVHELTFRVTVMQGISLDPGAEFVVQIPKPGIYHQTITVTSANGKVVKEYHVTIEKPFEFTKIAHQKFDNTLVINNNPKTNGGYRFVAYQWFRNDELIGEEQVYSAGDDAKDLLDPTASYYALLTTEEGDVIRVCPMTITHKGTRGVMLYPSPVRVGDQLTVQVSNPMSSLNGTLMQVYNMKGQQVYSRVLDGERTVFELPNTIQSGVYIAVMVIDNKQEVIKFIVE